jgi:hypothetical protein
VGFKRRGPLQSTGYEGSTFTKDRMAIGPCEHVDRSLVGLFGEATQALYAAVSAARTLKNPTDSERNALQQILVASAAIAATEAEAMVSLCSFALCAPAHIHARALGDIARRFLLLPKHPDVALKMYNSLEASRRELLRKVPEGHAARVAMEPFFDSADEVTMERIERRAYDGDDQSEGIFMSQYEARTLSKWNHADIIALADAGDRLLAAGERVRTSLVVDPDADLVIHRALGKVLAILYAMIALFGIQMKDRLDEFIRRHASFVERFREESEALKSRAAALRQKE